MSNVDMLPVALLTATAPDAAIIDAYVHSAAPEWTVLPTEHGTTASVFREEGHPLLVMSKPRALRYKGDLARVLEVDDAMVARASYLTEGLVRATEPQLPLGIATAIAEHCGGVMVVRTINSVV